MYLRDSHLEQISCLNRGGIISKRGEVTDRAALQTLLRHYLSNLDFSRKAVWTLTYWLDEMQVGKATPFSTFFPLNSLLTALRCHMQLEEQCTGCL